MSTFIGIAYLVAAVTFIFGLRFLGSPVTARNGNRVAAAGMTLALIVTLLSPLGSKILPTGTKPTAINWIIIFVAMAIGGAIGVFSAQKVLMTAMPQMVAIFNGMGGGAAAVVSIMELIKLTHGASIGGHESELATIMLGTAIGSVSFAGSIVAFAKLQELVGGGAIKIPFQPVVVGAMLAGLVALGAIASAVTADYWVFGILVALAICFGLLLVVPIGGADMPVIISLMNSFTGIAAALTGFVIGNELLIVAGALVGASGTLLTQLMAKAMNRPITNVLFGAFGATPAAGAGPAADTGGTVREISVDDAAMLMSYANQVIVVPGYGLAVAQAQHQVRELGSLLEEKGVSVKYGIHPVAGRMPGHMNVLLAESDVPYSQLYDMEQINNEFDHTDVALVVGANDVTNPAARNDPSSPIYGMPILNVDHAHNIIVMKRSMRPGFAGIDNSLYLDPKTAMLFGDAKDSLTKLVSAVKAAP